MQEGGSLGEVWGQSWQAQGGRRHHRKGLVQRGQATLKTLPSLCEVGAMEGPGRGGIWLDSRGRRRVGGGKGGSRDQRGGHRSGPVRGASGWDSGGSSQRGEAVRFWIHLFIFSNV